MEHPSAGGVYFSIQIKEKKMPFKLDYGAARYTGVNKGFTEVQLELLAV